MTVNFVHKSVLLRESVDWIVTDPKGIYVDCTLGGAGHSHAIAEELDPEGLLIGIDQDEDAIMAASKRLEDAACKVKIVHSNFRNLGTILEGLNLQRIFVTPGYNSTIIVRHGNYLTIYANLSEVYVRAGEKVSTGQNLGKIYSDSQDGNRTILTFQLWKERTKLNPELWLNL